MALSKAKRAKAVKATRADPELSAALERGGRIVLAAPYTSDRAEGDHVVVGVHDPEGDSLVALVDLEKGEVVSVEVTPARFQLDDDERADAERLAAQDKRVKAFLRGRQMNPLTRLYFPPKADARHRYAIVFLRPTTSARAYAVVDLTEDRVVELLDRRDLTRSV